MALINLITIFKAFSVIKSSQSVEAEDRMVIVHCTDERYDKITVYIRKHYNKAYQPDVCRESLTRVRIKH